MLSRKDENMRNLQTGERTVGVPQELSFTGRAPKQMQALRGLNGAALVCAKQGARKGARVHARQAQGGIRAIQAMRGQAEVRLGRIGDADLSRLAGRLLCDLSRSHAAMVRHPRRTRQPRRLDERRSLPQNRPHSRSSLHSVQPGAWPVSGLSRATGGSRGIPPKVIV